MSSFYDVTSAAKWLPLTKKPATGLVRLDSGHISQSSPSGKPYYDTIHSLYQQTPISLTLPPISTSIQATGGNITYVNGYKIHTFLTSGTFTVLSGSATVKALVVGGGGGGGGYIGGGGGGGVVKYTANLNVSGINTITVGDGGLGQDAFHSPGPSRDGTNGGSSSIGNLLVSAGGTWNPTLEQGGSSGSFTGGASNNNNGGGGGGAAANGANAVAHYAGNGGIGVLSSITGDATYYGGGGGGGYYDTNYPVLAYPGLGGLGGGGNGAYDYTWNLTNRPSGTPNTGGGGGGSTGGGNSGGGDGGSGIVIIAYPSPPITPPTIFATGGTVTYANGFTTHTFTSPSDTFALSSPASVMIKSLVVGGGGGGGSPNVAGGGGAGGAIYTTSVLPSGNYSVTVGAGGAHGTINPLNPSSGPGSVGASGGNSIFNSLTAPGGGGGGFNYGGSSNGVYGGCGGGAAGDALALYGGRGIIGGNGGRNNSSFPNGGGGGGGMGGNGQDANTFSYTAGYGGPGQTYVVNGTSYSVCGGGGGTGDFSSGQGGSGGGGNYGQDGAANTGGGGGGNTGNGGSGIVVISYYGIQGPPSPTISLVSFAWESPGTSTPGGNWQFFSYLNGSYAPSAITVTAKLYTGSSPNPTTVICNTVLTESTYEFGNWVYNTANSSIDIVFSYYGSDVNTYNKLVFTVSVVGSSGRLTTTFTDYEQN
jgi:hypothetical protein